MADALHQIVYLSQAVAPLDAADTAALAQAAAERNRLLGVTGLLLHDGARFIQALEGDPAAVRALMARIARDPRHYAIAYIADAPVTTRQFGDWAMDYHTLDDSDDDFVAEVKRALAGVDDAALLAAFIGFAVLGRSERRRGETRAATGLSPRV
ncbi:BLUF domain-containing protein [Sphingomonas sp. BK235]|uniref:BLUF domain-containing protein n=1 Tax=Sphingomonas sp. BK235 TaxID=2512131 RepID=UPI00104920BC|nr:BLUF domain-containing protein [Sphingomonas sp. BK235]TCP35938.1 FAD-dependent sensor of blue light [Sphingomonas sp. BK235]